MTEEIIGSYYGAYSLMYDGKETGMHLTVFFRHDATEAELEEIKSALLGFRLEGREVRIVKFEYLDGPTGEPNAIWTCLLELLDARGEGIDREGTKKMKQFSDRFSFRRNLKEEQYSFTMHASIGDSYSSGNGKKYEEFLVNRDTVERMGGIGAKFTLGRGYAKNLASKEIVRYFQ